MFMTDVVALGELLVDFVFGAGSSAEPENW